MRIPLLLACALFLLSGCSDDGTAPAEDRVASIRLGRTAALDDGATLQLTAEALDHSGRVLPAGLVRLAWSSSDEAVAGVAEGAVTGRHPGVARITAAAGRASATAEVTVRPVPRELAAVSGGAQEGAVGMPAPRELAVWVSDRHGGGVAGVEVEFAVVKGGGTVAPATVQTDAQGIARAAWTLGRAPGENAVEARLAGRSAVPAVFVAVARPGPAAQLEKLGGDGQQASAASQLPQPLVVRVTDALGNPVAGASVGWTASSGGSVAPALSVSDALGEARATWMLGPGAGEQAVEARAAGGTAAPVQFSARAGVGTAARLAVVSGDGQEATVTRPLAAPLVVRVVDAPGNPLAGVKVSWTLGYGGGTVAPAESVSDARGYARATWTLGTIMAQHRLEARAAGLPPATFTATARVGPAAGLAKHGGDGQESEVGYTLPAPLVVYVTDAYGNPVPGVPVQWSGSGSMKSAEAETDGRGLARGTWVLGTRTGAQAMSATAAGKTVSFSASAHQGPSAAVEVSPGAVTLPVGETRQLAAVVTDLFGNVGDGRGRALAWSSSDPGVATVTASGLVTAAAPGGTTITATRDGVSGSARVTVPPVPVASVAVAPAAASFVEGSTRQFSAVLTDAGGNPLTGREVAWTSSNPAVATVSSGGLVTGVAAGGPVTITAVAEGKAGTASATVTRTPIAAIYVDAPDFGYIGDLTNVHARLVDSAGRTLSGRKVTFSSSDEAVIRISPDGVMSSVGPVGTATITATSEGKSGSTTVQARYMYPTFGNYTCHFVRVGYGCISNAVMRSTQSNGMYVRVPRNITSITSSDPNIATVTLVPSAQDGVVGEVRGIAPGTVTLTATYRSRNGLFSLQATMLLTVAP